MIQLALDNSTLIYLTPLLLTSYILYRLFISPLLNPLRSLPGPAPTSFLSGNQQDLIHGDPGSAFTRWFAEAGNEVGVIKYGGWFGGINLSFTDPASINHVLMDPYLYRRSSGTRGFLGLILGQGLIFAEGDDHKRQRRIMNPAFSPNHLKGLTPSIFKYAFKLREKWSEAISTQTSDSKAFKNASEEEKYRKEGKEGEVVLNVSGWLSRTTLDIIGLTGFGYNFDTLENPHSNTTIGKAFASLVPDTVLPRTASGPATLRFLGTLFTLFPFIKYFPVGALKRLRKGFKNVEQVGREVLEGKKKEVEEGGGLEDGGGKDLIDLLLKSNMTETKNKMNDEELSGQMTTFILAGHETTATALTWTLLELSLNKQVQDKLRKEVREANAKMMEDGRDELTYEELMGLEYLDAVAREVLRFQPPVAFTNRIAQSSDLIPLSTPVKLSNGKILTSIPVKKGDSIMFSHNTVNTDERAFGEDAKTFRPERWLEDGILGANGEGKEKEGEKRIPSVGVWSHILTFLAGPRSCIGYRFAIMELKAILAVIIADFAFEVRDEEMIVEKRSSVVTRPVIKGEENLGYRLPLKVSLVRE